MLKKTKNTFKKTQRITKTQEYKTNFAKSRPIKGDNLKIFYSRNNENERKVGIIISKKVKGAVKRNRYKRLIKEYFRLNIKTMNAGRNVIVILLSEIKPIKYGIIANEITEILKRAGIMGRENKSESK